MSIFVNETTFEPLMNWTTAVPTPPHEAQYSLAVGFICVGVAAVLFGSNLLPIKKYETGDGLFFQWIYATSIWIVGFVLLIIKGFPVFHPLAMLGGFLWTTGNVLTVPILKTIGLGQGILIWASLNMISGWASDRFGWFGLQGSIPNSVALNYVGVVICLVSAFVYMFLKTTTTPPVITLSDTTVSFSPVDSSPVVENTYTTNVGGGENTLLKSPSLDDDAANRPVFYDRMAPIPKRIFGTVAAISAGILFGLNFVPVIYVQDNCIGASSDGLDYVFAHFTGIFVTSTVYLAVYCAAMCNRPRVYPRVILPGVVCGVMWGVADICWFVANDALSPPISFPIITTLPAIIGAMWGMFAFGEIRGRKNYIVLSLAIFFGLAGSTLTGLSKSKLFGETKPEPYAKYNCTNPFL